MIERVTAMQAVKIGIGADKRQNAPAPYQLVIQDEKACELFTVALDQAGLDNLREQINGLGGIHVPQTPKLVIPRGKVNHG